MTVRFDDAWNNAQEIAEDLCAQGIDVVLVRDLIGRLSLVVDGDIPDGTADRFRESTGSFASASPTISTEELFNASSITDSPDLLVREKAGEGRGRFATLERSAVGADWTRPGRQAHKRRVTLYGFKGGVGRSTATLMLARHFASLGLCVLVVDLDLESPGVSTLLQEQDLFPEHGVVDHLVEAAVGNEDGLELVTQSRITPRSGNGEVWVAPASGGRGADRDYLAKLNRVYADLPGGPDGGPRRFGDRLDAAINACEDQVADRSRRPDVVILDSRAGIHDIAAVAITQLSSSSLLFASNNPQTWSGYGMLFKNWQQNLTTEMLDSVRGRLKMVASMVPPKDKDSYLDEFRDEAQQCFATTIYEDTPGGDLDAFNFAPEDVEAPHSPLPILFSTDLVGLNPETQPDWHENRLVEAAYEEFLEGATRFVLEGADDVTQL